MRGSVERVVFLPVLMTWSVALVVGALPNVVRPRLLDRAATMSRRMFRAVGTRPASEVFSGRRGNRKRRTHCAVVEGVRTDGTHVHLYASYPGCKPFNRLWDDIFNVLMMRYVGNRLIEGVMRGRERQEALGRVRTAKKLDRVSQYFCDADPDPGGAPVERIYIHWYSEFIEYDTGRVVSHADNVHQWSCGSGRRVGGAWPKLELHPVEGLRIAR